MQTFTLSEPCELRPIRFLELHELDGWRIKTYGIAYNRPAPEPKLVDAAKALARGVFPSDSDAGHYGVGTLGIHQGRGSNFIFMDWWSNENELNHRVFISTGTEADEFEESTATGLIACIWDMRVMCFERDAWVKHVLRNPQGPDIEAYLDDRLNTDA